MMASYYVPDEVERAEVIEWAQRCADRDRAASTVHVHAKGAPCEGCEHVRVVPAVTP